MLLEKITFYYVIIINLIAFIVYGIDKRKAMLHQWRIPEATLLMLALIGGSIGAWFGMQFFHHKTRHPKFYIGVPLILIVEFALLVVAYRYFR